MTRRFLILALAITFAEATSAAALTFEERVRAQEKIERVYYGPSGFAVGR